MQQIVAPGPVLHGLNEESVFTFTHFYLSRRYAGLIPHGRAPFASTEDFVRQMLQHLIHEGPMSARERFLSGPMAGLFRKIEARIGGRNFDFDATVFLPLLLRLPPGSVILDFGAGRNTFLPVMADRAARDDLRYYATDYYVDAREVPASERVAFVPQPGPAELPAVGPFDLVLLRRVAHHVQDFRSIGEAIRKSLKTDGLLILIEDSYDDGDPSVAPEMVPLMDLELTERFYRRLNNTQRIRFLQFNDFYSNHVYHNWPTMPLPMAHRTFDQWRGAFAELGMQMDRAYNMGFPLNSLNLHQAATGILVFRKEA